MLRTTLCTGASRARVRERSCSLSHRTIHGNIVPFCRDERALHLRPVRLHRQNPRGVCAVDDGDRVSQSLSLIFWNAEEHEFGFRVWRQPLIYSLQISVA